jgi:hypothetical protein
VIAWIAFLYSVVRYLQIPFLNQFFGAFDDAWYRLMRPLLPIGNNQMLTLSDFLYYLMMGIVLVEVFQRGRISQSRLSLKKIALAEQGKLLWLQSKAEGFANVGTYDYLQDICYIESRQNTWLTIILTMCLVAAPGVFLAVQMGNGGVIYLGIFLILALVSLYYLLKGTVQVGTADGTITALSADKAKAAAVFQALVAGAPYGFIQVELSGAFTSRQVCFRRERITGMVEASSFPWLWLVLTLLTAAGAVAANTNVPYRQAAPLGLFLVPVALLALTIYLATRKQRIVKLIGMHLYSLGNHSSVPSILSEVTQTKM